MVDDLLGYVGVWIVVIWCSVLGWSCLLYVDFLWIGGSGLFLLVGWLSLQLV